ncbi:MAG: permease-like cell division protein FtsX [Lutispora sp.]|nr:permease-like cell division protein FtsX [Lutispora sp.]MDD4834736.1 permease-like cell division protein FtsX [Lutispora sp.]
MRNILYNTGYFLKEAKAIIKLNLLSNIFSLLSTGLIFFILTMVSSGWWISSQVVETIQGEAEVSVYFKEDIKNNDVMKLIEDIKTIAGVREVRLVDEDEAYSRMVEILGNEAKVLSYLDDNPFNPFIEVKIHLENMESVVKNLSHIKGIEQIRDNREALERLHSIAEVLKILGYLVVAAVAISTLVIISHIIRMGIYDNRDQINTLRLLGAPEMFIAFPFLLEGLMLTIGGGLLAATLSAFSLKYFYAQMAGPLPFIPLPPREALVGRLITLVILLSAIMGVTGSLFGLSSAKND